MKQKTYTYLFLLFTTAYALLTLFAPSDPAALKKYNITQTKAHILALTIVIPLVLIWLTALYGMVKFRNYAQVIEKTKEGPAFAKIAAGITALAFSLPVNATFAAILNYILIRRPSILVEVTILKNYFNLILPAIGLVYIGLGAQLLIKNLKQKDVRMYPRFALFGVVSLSSIYVWMITTRPLSEKGDVVYQLPNFFVVLTIAIPYLIVWCRGLFAVYQLFVYRNRVRGSVYKKSLGLLAKGVTAVVILSILTQLLLTVSGRLTRLHLTPLLGLVYLIVALNAVGYGLIARGANELKQIEEV